MLIAVGLMVVGLLLVSLGLYLACLENRWWKEFEKELRNRQE